MSGTCDDNGKESAIFRTSAKGRAHSQKIAMVDYTGAANVVLDWIESGSGRSHGISTLADIDRIAHRVVHGADQFNEPVRITDQVTARIADLDQLAPLHNAAACSVIEAARHKIPSHPMYAVFDTAFHRSIPDEAALYALPIDLARKHGSRRYGFHETSHEYIRVRHYIGAYMAALGGADAIVFGGGIGENASVVRQRICEGLEWSGAVLSHDRNAKFIDQEGCVSEPNRSPEIWVVPTEENLMMARSISMMAA